MVKLLFFWAKTELNCTLCIVLIRTYRGPLWNGKQIETFEKKKVKETTIMSDFYSQHLIFVVSHNMTSKFLLIGGWFSSIYPDCWLLIENPLAGKFSWKNGLSVFTLSTNLAPKQFWQNCKLVLLQEFVLFFYSITSILLLGFQHPTQKILEF